jgi:lipopolysaccharide export system protein LptA
MRTLVLVAAGLLVVALVAFLAVGKGKNPFNRRDLPQRLGIEIQQEANGVTYTQAHGGHTLFKIHASKVVQLKEGNHALLHDVKIELYGEDGSRVDRIEGNEFEYDPKEGMAKATGPVEITLMRPGVAPAIAPKATPEQVVGDKAKGKPLASAAETIARGEIHVKTSGLTFDQKSGVATTSQHVEFAMAQGAGSAMGATFDSQQGRLVLDHAVELNERRGAETVLLHAQHAEFERTDQVCSLRAATAGFKGGQATAGEAKVLFREDGSVVRLDATSGVTLVTATGSRLAAHVGWLEFDEQNQPRHGHLEGGVTMDSAKQNARQQTRLHGTAPTAELEFAPQGELRHAHLERGVEFNSEELSQGQGEAKNEVGPVRLSRQWRSPLADVTFRAAGHGQVEPDIIHGVGGVVVTGQSQRGKAAPVPSKLVADEVTGKFGAGAALTGMTGLGHTRIEKITATGARQTCNGDRLEAHFETGAGGKSGAAQIQSAALDGHVVLVEEPTAKPGAPAAAPMRATGGRAVYEGAGEWLHLTLSPRVEDDDLQLTADKIDVSQDSGDAFAHGNVKATWAGSGPGKNGQQGRVALGGQGPAHAIAAEAQLSHATTVGASGEVTFRGQARLWQQANSVSAPVIVIVLDRQKQTLMARTTSAAEPVRAVLVSAAESGKGMGREASKDASKPGVPAVIRVRGGDLKYSDAERTAVMHGGVVGNVVAETGAATSVSNEVELVLLPTSNHAGKEGGAAQVDRLTARGHVVMTSQGRRGTGEQLIYSSETGEYVLTGTAAVPPRMTDPARGTVSGTALIFHSQDDSVSVEGRGRKTTTETSAPK